jgi:hypothetical protein
MYYSYVEFEYVATSFKLLKRFKQYFGTNHSNYETPEREKERGEQIFSELVIDR